MSVAVFFLKKRNATFFYPSPTPLFFIMGHQMLVVFSYQRVVGWLVDGSSSGGDRRVIQILYYGG